MSEFKFIHDTVHGSIKIDRFVLELLELPELQRLNGIRQLGLSYLVFPGANHSRLEHSLGVSYVAKRMARELNLSPEEQDLVTAAGLLHDIGHGPYSHTLEAVLYNIAGIDHMNLTQNIITGDYELVPVHELKYLSKKKRVSEVLENYGLEPKRIAELVKAECPPPYSIEHFFMPKPATKSEKSYLAQIIHGAIDADQMDYLLRDSHYTGVAYGTIDLDRLLQTISIYNNNLVVYEKGISAVEGMLVARALMYTSVYFHKTVRIAELMMARAVERALEHEQNPDIIRMTDAELFDWLLSGEEYQRKIALMLKYRMIFKKVYSRSIEDLNDDNKNAIKKLTDPRTRQKAENELCHVAHVPEGSAIIDIPLPELLVSEPRITKTDIKILVGKRLIPFSKLSPLANALKVRDVASWVIMVAAHPDYRDKIAKISEQVLFHST